MPEKNKLIKDYKSPKILIIGDVMLDRYIYYSKKSVSESNAPVAKYLKMKEQLGGAANVAKNILNLGGQPLLLGIIGNDWEGKELKQILKEDNIDFNLVVDRTRKTTVKSRIIIDKNQFCRLDSEYNFALSGKIEKKLLQNISKAMERVNGVVISDYLKGTITEKIAKKLVKISAKKGVKVFVDSKNENLEKFKDCFLIKINRKEAEIINKIKLNSIQKIKKSAINLKMKYGCNVVITLDKDGIAYANGDNIVLNLKNKDKNSIKSTIGAGDAVLAGITMAILSGKSFKESAKMSYMCGDLSIKKERTVFCNISEIIKNLKIYEKGYIYR